MQPRTLNTIHGVLQAHTRDRASGSGTHSQGAKQTAQASSQVSITLMVPGPLPRLTLSYATLMTTCWRKEKGKIYV